MRVGIAGNGTIIPVFIEGAREAGMQIACICGRPASIDKLNALAERFSIPEIYTDYEEMLSSDIDAVYVGVSNYMHYEYAKKALLNGKHVICEKPFTSNYAQAEVLYSICKEKHLYLFEAIMNQYNPSFEELKQAVTQIGEIRIAELSFSQYSRRYQAFKNGEILPVFDPLKAGGALMDINLYNVYLMIGIFGAPLKVTYHANIVRDVDTSGVLVMEYPGFKASLVGAKDCSAPMRVSIHGDLGYIESDQRSSAVNRFKIQMNDGTSREYETKEKHHNMYYEMSAFKRMLETDAFDEMMAHLDVSLTVMKIMDEARNQNGILTDFAI